MTSRDDAVRAEAQSEALRRWPLWRPTGDYELDAEGYDEQSAQGQNAESEALSAAFADGFVAGADRAEAELDAIKERHEEVSQDEGWWIGGAWGDYGEAVVPLRILSYVIDGELNQKIDSIDPGFALTYAEQVSRADRAESFLDRILHAAHVSYGPAGVPEWRSDVDYLREGARGMEEFYKPFGSNLRATVVELLREVAFIIEELEDKKDEP